MNYRISFIAVKKLCFSHCFVLCGPVTQQETIIYTHTHTHARARD